MKSVTTFSQVAGVKNPRYREEWVRRQLETISRTRSAGLSLLDVGAGTGPYRAFAIGKGFTYRAHDFGQYVPPVETSTQIGQHNTSWGYTELDFRCDLLDIPDDAISDVVLCSEVLEHVPDPVASLRKLAELAAPGGDVLVTVPLLSLMHQAPHWHASGLSPFFFLHWCPKIGLEVQDVLVHGDYADLMTQEIERLVLEILRRPFNGRVHRRAVAPTVAGMMRAVRRRISGGVLSSGGFGVTVHAKKLGSLPRAAEVAEGHG